MPAAGVENCAAAGFTKDSAPSRSLRQRGGRGVRPYTSGLRVRTHVAGGAPGCRDVALRGVIHDHAIGVETPAQGADGAFHALDPAPGQAVAITVVVQGDDFVLEGPEQILSVAGIVNAHVGVSSPAADGEAIDAVKSFRPPAVQNGKVQAAVQDDFLSAGA